MDNSEVKKILQEIEKGYNLVSDKFSETRKNFWSDLEFIEDYVKDGDDILDFGCGNGRLLELFSEKNIRYWGVDISEKLIEAAKQKYYSENIIFQKISSSEILSPTKFTIAESGEESKIKKSVSNNVSNSYSRNLVGDKPFPDNFFNAVYSIAVFHHFPGKEYRKKMAEELYRVTKPGGYVIITVWNLWQRKYIKEILRNWEIKILKKSSLDWNDCYITFKNNQGEVFKRYHHAFKKTELIKLFKNAGFKVNKVIINRNIIFIGKK